MKRSAKIIIEESEKKQNEQLIYAGPDIKNVIKKYTVYNNGLPEHVKKLSTEVPAISKLIIPVERLKNVNDKLLEEGSAYNIFYRQIEEYIKGGQ